MHWPWEVFEPSSTFHLNGIYEILIADLYDSDNGALYGTSLSEPPVHQHLNVALDPDVDTYLTGVLRVLVKQRPRAKPRPNLLDVVKLKPVTYKKHRM